MARKITMNGQSRKSVAEATLTNYRRHFYIIFKQTVKEHYCLEFIHYNYQRWKNDREPIMAP